MDQMGSESKMRAQTQQYIDQFKNQAATTWGSNSLSKHWSQGNSTQDEPPGRHARRSNSVARTRKTRSRAHRERAAEVKRRQKNRSASSPSRPFAHPVPAAPQAYLPTHMRSSRSADPDTGGLAVFAGASASKPWKSVKSEAAGF